MGRIQSAFNVGATFGPIIGAWIYELFVSQSLEIILIGYRFFGGGIPFFVAGIFGLVQVIVALRILRDEKVRKKQEVIATS